MLQPAAPFDLLALFVSHCMLLGESDPPQASGVLWSTSYPGHAPEVLPVDGHGWFFLNDPFAAADRSILPRESCFTAPVDELVVCVVVDE